MSKEPLSRNADFDRDFWRWQACRELREAFRALEDGRIHFGDWERLFLSAALDHFRDRNFKQSAISAQRIFHERRGQPFPGLYPRKKLGGSSRGIRRSRKSRALTPCLLCYWNDVDLNLTLGEYNIVHLLASKPGNFVTYRAVYDRLRHEGFIAGCGVDGYRANVRSAIRRIRNKFRALDPTFDKIENSTGFGYCWKKPD
jgi:hypothetical protein